MTLKIALYLIITIAVTVILAVSQQKAGLSFDKVTLPQLAPAIAVLVIFLIYKNLPARINLSFDTTILLKSLVAFILPMVLFATAFLIGKIAGINVKIPENLPKLLPLMITGMLIGALAEEIGWRNFLQPVFETKYSALLASIIVGITWGLWHIGHYKNGLLFMAAFLLFTISASIIIAWLLRNTAYNLIISTVFHCSINVGFLIFFHNSLADSKMILINGIVWLIPAMGIIILTGKDLVI